MRIGMNPQKEERKVILNTNHRIVIVVYIPNEEGFYKDSLSVFKLSLDSLIATVNSHVAITVINNGSYEKVSDLLGQYFKEKKIDTLISHNLNIGKIDAQIGAARGAREKLITLTDADILFSNGWQEKVEEIFSVFPNVGSVSPIPVRTGLYAGTSSVLKYIILKKIKVKFIEIPENFKNFNKFLSSINWDLDTDKNLKWPVVEHNKIKAIIGSAHQVLTIDRDILFTTSPSNPSLTLVGGNSEHNYVDVPIDKSGKLRLATFNNYAFHIGNKVEDWMIDIQQKNIENTLTSKSKFNVPISSDDLFNSKLDNKVYGLKKKLLKKLFSFFYDK
ncbi:glycosyltransferase family A protein [Flavobacterium sp. LHD-80]|uniref:glycosyltransferase family A protein n=1 Tax=Flavobacterium sp. LHD-80 TaxID=3071411 RepID=UPI0027DFE506|nr:glycosyltransferase family A protein [Flavobacterium sp. LHD-80]MDQ6472085.1 glycosyltransferase family A protein [Flavobacterium sp. LHD-80]